MDSSQGTYGNLGPGVLFFSDWESITIERFDSATNTLYLVEEFPIESLEDLCEVEFSNPIILLGGFGRKTGKWMKWKIRQPKMHAEFAEYQEDECRLKNIQVVFTQSFN